MNALEKIRIDAIRITRARELVRHRTSVTAVVLRMRLMNKIPRTH